MENKNEESKEVPDRGNLFFNFGDIFSEKIGQKIYRGKIIMVGIGSVALVSSAVLYFVQKKEETE
ncbi:hypothetical protein KHA90_20965 [Flavobacterium psychroterrae]|uniref:Uncharacterized protein n=1 Tax=Flavobacterium psychroterrae TaxID=2133767 RepID=A0ABS5PGX5_9FLAO|nr:hypothetical protein [Flavobacterium psychroterrae]MBS7233490.1 hypothetical protein [Flavobacterium psychroterrae]